MISNMVYGYSDFIQHRLRPFSKAKVVFSRLTHRYEITLGFQVWILPASPRLQESLELDVTHRTRSANQSSLLHPHGVGPA